ncbi:GntR family transcriptional regulator [Hungatella effluvii]|uniref:GntR family transcriptional regulator n=1 Tax=Hungatella effluvii TaxID=1096246 RepID=UPI002A8250FC|nr:GntR family transcriptional regulator [Hungatella effluvii]
MNIILSNTSGSPIYEQIAEQIKALIISGQLAPETPLPSMRLLAKELRVSLITTKRAYEELERDGYLRTMTGKGSFVAGLDNDLIRGEQLRLIEDQLRAAVNRARLNGIPLTELEEMLVRFYEEESK